MKVEEIRKFYFRERHDPSVTFRAVLQDIPFLLSEHDRLTKELTEKDKRIKELEGKLKPIEDIMLCGECNILYGTICSQCARVIKQSMEAK